jgi:hypothetical protein
VILQLIRSTAAVLPHRKAVMVLHSTAVMLLHSTAVMILCSTAVILLHSTAVLLLHSMYSGAVATVTKPSDFTPGAICFRTEQTLCNICSVSCDFYCFVCDYLLRMLTTSIYF